MLCTCAGKKYIKTNQHPAWDLLNAPDDGREREIINALKGLCKIFNIAREKKNIWVKIRSVDTSTAKIFLFWIGTDTPSTNKEEKCVLIPKEEILSKNLGHFTTTRQKIMTLFPVFCLQWPPPSSNNLPHACSQWHGIFRKRTTHKKAFSWARKTLLS